MNRRDWLRTAAAGAAALTLNSEMKAESGDLFTLPPLPYPNTALIPAIDAKTMEIHHDKHHAAYVKALNDAAAKEPAAFKRPLEEIIADLKSVPESVRTTVQNNGGGHLNHSMFWASMAPNAGGAPSGKLGDAIKSTFGDFAKFQAAMKEAGLKRFGSGWAWLVVDGGKLAITSTANQDSPLMQKQKPLLGLDVWEHAYYLQYQNRRPEYIDAWWSVVNWKAVDERFAKA